MSPETLRQLATLLVVLAPCACAAPSTVASQSPADAEVQRESPKGLAAASTDTAWLAEEKKTLELEDIENLEQLQQALTEPKLDGVTHLRISGLGLGPDLAEFLAGSQLTDKLLALDLSDNDLGAEGASRLVASPALGALQELDLGGNDIGDEGARALAEADSLTLKSLNLSGNGIGAGGVKSLVAAEHLSQITSIDLSMNPIRAEGAEALATGGLTHLKLLFLLGCEVGPQGAKAIAESSSMKSLSVLALSGNAVGDEGAAALARSKHLSHLTLLDLSANGIGDEGAMALAESPTLASITALELYGNEVGDQGEASLRQRFEERLGL